MINARMTIPAGGSPNVAFDTFSLSAADSDGGPTASGTIVVGSLTNGILLAIPSWEDALAGNASVTGVSSNVGGAFTQLPSSAAVWISGIDFGSDIWYLLTPAAGSHVCTFTMSENTNVVYPGLMSAQNVSQSAPFGTVVVHTDVTQTQS